MGREVGGKFKTEGIYAYLWLIHALIWQKLTQHCKANILQLKINFLYLWLIHVDVRQKPTQFCKAIILQLKNKEI